MKEKEYTPDRLWQITTTEDKMRLMASCVEDCSRFLTTVGMFPVDEWRQLQDRLEALKPYITPGLSPNASYGWNGKGCGNNHQRRFIAQGYCTYKSILTALANEYQWDNVHSGSMLTCEEGGAPMQVRPLPSEADTHTDLWLARDSHGYALHREKPLWRKWANTEGWESSSWIPSEYTDIIREAFRLPKMESTDEPIRVTLTVEGKK